VRLNVIGNRIKVDTPPDFPGIEPIDLERNFVQLDIDYYAHGVTATSKFNAPAIVEAWSKIIPF
jgi:hypothetical protein